MYDFIITALSEVWKRGLNVTTIGAILFLALRQEYFKRLMKKRFPFFFNSKSEVKDYVENQIVIMENQKIMMEGMGLEWHVPTLKKDSKSSAEKKEKSWPWHVKMLLPVRYVKKFMKFGGKKMRNYLRKLGSRKFQALLTSLIINGVSAYLFLTGTLDIEGVINTWMPIINMTVGTISTWVYIIIEGKIDAAQGGKENELDYTQDTSA